MKTEVNALVLLKKGPIFSIATFFKKIFFFSKKENLEEVISEEQIIINLQNDLEEKKIETKSLTIEQIKLLEKAYQRQIEEIERQIKLLEARNSMCKFKLQIYEKEKNAVEIE